MRKHIETFTLVKTYFSQCETSTIVDTLGYGTCMHLMDTIWSYWFEHVVFLLNTITVSHVLLVSLGSPSWSNSWVTGVNKITQWHQIFILHVFKNTTGWWFEPLWKIWTSIGMIIPNIWENKKCSKPPTSFKNTKSKIPITFSYLGTIASIFVPRYINWRMKTFHGSIPITCQRALAEVHQRRALQMGHQPWLRTSADVELGTCWYHWYLHGDLNIENHGKMVT